MFQQELGPMPITVVCTSSVEAFFGYGAPPSIQPKEVKEKQCQKAGGSMKIRGTSIKGIISRTTKESFD